MVEQSDREKFEVVKNGKGIEIYLDEEAWQKVLQFLPQTEIDQSKLMETLKSHLSRPHVTILENSNRYLQLNPYRFRGDTFQILKEIISKKVLFTEDQLTLFINEEILTSLNLALHQSP